MPRRDFSIMPSRRTWRLIFIWISLALLVVGSLYFRIESRQIREEKFEELAAIGELKAAQVVQWRRERLGDAANLGESPLFRRAVEEWLRNPGDDILRQDLWKRLELTKEVFGYADVVLVGLDGRLLLSPQEKLGVAGEVTQRTMAEALSGGKTVLSDLFRDASGSICLETAIPVFGVKEVALAVLILESEAHSFLFPVIQSWPTPSRSAETLLVRQEGEEVVFLNDLRHRADSALSFRLPLSQMKLPAAQLALGKEGRFKGKDYRGTKVLADIRPIAGSPWFLVTKMDSSEILAEAGYREGITILLVAVLILLAAATTSLIYRQRQAYIYHNLYESEKQRRETEEELRTTLYSIGDAVITTDIRGRIRVMNPVAERLTGWSEAEAAAKPLREVFRIINEETREEAKNPVERVLGEGIVVGLANHTVLIARDGSEIPIADAGAPIRSDENVITGVVLVFRDQTEERAARRALRESEERYRAVVEHSQNGILIVGEDYKFSYVNDELCTILGSGRDEIIGRDFREFLDEESRRLVADRYVRRQRGEEVPPRYEFNVVKKDGEIRRVEISSTIVKDSGGTVHTIAQLLDITERKRAEEALQASEEKYRILHEFSGEPIFSFGADLKMMEINVAACDYIGRTREELLGKDIFELGILHPDDLDLAVGNMHKLLSREKPLVSEKLRFKGKHGLYGIFQVTSTAVKRNDDIVAITNVCRDVTLEEQLYSALEASERRYRFLFNAGNDAVFVYGLTKQQKPGKFVEVNDKACSITGYSKEELMGLSFVDLIAPEQREQVDDHQRILIEKKHLVFERTLVTKSGRRILFEVSSHFFELNGKSTVLAILRDITERKKAEEALQSALNEKEAMLREIHHRVKNNMQIMSSLLRLQARHIEKDEARQALEESQARIRSMAMIHERLYQSKHLASIDFANYIERMVTHLFTIFKVDPERVRFQSNVRDVQIDVNRAIPCGLIINELVSNALKHAFFEGKGGEIKVRMFKDEAGKHRLVVKDTGRGFPKSIDVHKPKTLGLQIVVDLVKQLEGKLDLRRDGGTEFEITF